MKKILLILCSLLLSLVLLSCEDKASYNLSEITDSINPPDTKEKVEEVLFRFEKITKETKVDKVVELISKYKMDYYNVTNYNVEVLESSDNNLYPISKILGTRQFVNLKHNSSGYYSYDDYVVKANLNEIREIKASYHDAYSLISGKRIIYNNKNYAVGLYDNGNRYKINDLPFEIKKDDSLCCYLNKGSNISGLFNRVFYLTDTEFTKKFPNQDLSNYQSASFELYSNYIVLNITNNLGLFDKEMQDFVLHLNNDYYMNYKAYLNIETQAIEYVDVEFYSGSNELIPADLKVKLNISYRLDSLEGIADNYNSEYKYLKEKATKKID